MNPARTFWLVAVLFGLVCAPLLLSSGHTNYSADEESYHLPAVRQIRAHWPRVDLVQDSLSAVSPAYHYVLATISLVTGPSVTALRLVNWAVSLGCLAVLWRLLAPAGAALATAAVLPLACSNFFVKSACWIVTDNAGLLAVAGVMAWSLAHGASRRPWAGGVLATAATLARQVHCWTAVPVLLALRRPDGTASGWRRVGGYAILALPFAALGALVVTWGALVPPRWQNEVAHVAGSSALAGPCYLLAIIALLSPAYLLAGRDGTGWSGLRWWLLAGAAVGAFLWLFAATDFDPRAGRWGGYLWTLAAHTPVLAHRSLAFALLVPAGGAALGCILARLHGTGDRAAFWWWTLSLAAWIATTLPSRLAFHRYFEPMTLLFLITWLRLVARAAPERPTDQRGLVGLAVAQLALTLLTAHRAVLVPVSI
jgi:hypothetical protein